jgi:hypothetical protein
MASRRIDPRIKLLIQNLDAAYLKRGWHGPVLRKVLKGLAAELAHRHPIPGRHSVWELALHTAWWKYTVRRRITGDSDLVFPRSGANFPLVPTWPESDQWAADLRLLDEQHELLRDAVLDLPPTRLDRKRPKSTWTYSEEIQGATAHDLYHGGQMMMLRRMMGA